MTDTRMPVWLKTLETFSKTLRPLRFKREQPIWDQSKDILSFFHILIILQICFCYRCSWMTDTRMVQGSKLLETFHKTMHMLKFMCENAKSGDIFKMLRIFLLLKYYFQLLVLHNFCKWLRCLLQGLGVGPGVERKRKKEEKNYPRHMIVTKKWNLGTFRGSNLPQKWL